MRDAVERFIADKARIASVLNSLKNEKNFQYRCCTSRENRGKNFLKMHWCFITYKDTD